MINLALVIYHALDYQHSEDEERLISPDLEGLITEMTACELLGKQQQTVQYLASVLVKSIVDLLCTNIILAYYSQSNLGFHFKLYRICIYCNQNQILLTWW